MIQKVVIPVAGLGTRLLPATKQQPKEMLPIFALDACGELCLKPFIQLVFENLYDNGLREFCFVVGRGKRSIEDHFTLDNDFVEYLKRQQRLGMVKELKSFYRRISNSHIIFLNQPVPKGFGDAVYQARPFTGEEPFVVNAGDDFIISKNGEYLDKLTNIFEERSADAAFLVERVEDPRKYGVIDGRKIGKGLYQVKGVEEKPKHPQSDIAIVAIYIFTPKIYNGIEKARSDTRGEDTANSWHSTTDQGRMQCVRG